MQIVAPRSRWRLVPARPPAATALAAVAVAVLAFTLGAEWGKSQTAGGRNNLWQVSSLVQASASESAQQQSMRGKPALRIPKRLHHIFIVDKTDPKYKNVTVWPHHRLWVEGCKYHHSPEAGWEYKMWDADDCERLVEQHYPFFLDFYKNNVTLFNEKSDMMRYIVLHHYGGLYLDTDVHCFRESSDMLASYDVVLQGTHSGEGTGSAAIASVPGAPIWLATLDMVRQRTPKSGNWGKSIERTGPDLLADAVELMGVERKDGMFAEQSVQKGLVYHVHPPGTWFLPCNWWNYSCFRQQFSDMALGTQDMTNIVGAHRFVGSWIGGKENGAGVPNVTKELCEPKPNGRRRLQAREHGLEGPAAATDYAAVWQSSSVERSADESGSGSLDLDGTL